MRHPGKRLTIIHEEEMKELYDLPQFSAENKRFYFAINSVEEEELNKLRTLRSKFYFILQLGYFKAKNRFFTFTFQQVKEDTNYVLQLYFPQEQSLPKGKIFKQAKLAQQSIILNLYGYRLCTREDRSALQKKAAKMVLVYTKPIYLFKELLSWFQAQKIVIPKYSFFQSVISKALTMEQQRLVQILKKDMTPAVKESLNKLMTEQGIIDLSFLKREPKDFSYQQFSAEMKRFKALESLYDFACGFLTKLQISNENIKYYSSLIDYYSIYRIRRLKTDIVYIYLLCFVFHRFQKLNDHLIDCFLFYVNKYTHLAKQTAQEEIIAYRIEGNKHLKSVAKILRLFLEEGLTDDLSFGEIKRKAFQILEKNKFEFVAQYISKVKFDEIQFEWDQYKKMKATFKRNLRPIFLNMNFDSYNETDPLIQVLTFFKKLCLKGRSLKSCNSDDLPLLHVPVNFRNYLKINKENNHAFIDPDKYEFYLYRALRNKLESGEIFSRDSTRFRSFEDDLISKAQWDSKRPLLDEMGLAHLNISADELLAKLEKELEEKYETVNRRIYNGKNRDIKIVERAGGKQWRLPYEKEGEPINNPFYESLSQIGIAEVLKYVDHQTNFMSAFTHILDRYVKSIKDEQAIIAAVIAYGTNSGLTKMADVSDVNYQELFAAANNFIRLETLKEANDQISNAVTKLTIFQSYHMREETVHSSSDGQKFETQIDTINSRYSSKYFGLNKGVTVYTLVANHIPINAKIISTHEHESHFVFDILFSNTSAIEPTVHSTDTHGTNEVNFAILYLFGYQFAPRYKNMQSKSHSLHGFKKLSEYKKGLVKPTHKINVSLIKEEWQNIQRIMVSLALKATRGLCIITK